MEKSFKSFTCQWNLNNKYTLFLCMLKGVDFYCRILFLCLMLILLTASTPMCREEIPLDFSSWVHNQYQNGPLESTDSALLLNGVAWTNGRINDTGFTDGNGVLSISSFDHTGSTSRIKLNINSNNRYLWMQAKPHGLPVPLLTTHHSYAGSFVVPENTWLYITVSIDEGQGDWLYLVAENNYESMGGLLLHRFSGTLTQEQLHSFESAPFIISFHDNYGGVDTSLTVAELTMGYDDENNGDTPDPLLPIDPVIHLSDFSVPEWAKVSVAYTAGELILSWPEILGATDYILLAGLEAGKYVLQVPLGRLTSFRLPLEVLGETVFHVMINATDGEDEQAIGDAFQVGSPNSFAIPPKLLLECDGETMWLKWNNIQGADSFLVNVGTEPGSFTLSQKFGLAELDDSSVIHAPVDILPAGPLYFAVQAQRGEETGPLSNGVSFGRYTAGEAAIINGGAEIFSSLPASGKEAAVFFYPVEEPAHIGGEVVASYAFFSSQELPATEITIPVKGISSADDIQVVHMQGPTGPADPLEFVFNPVHSSVTVQLQNNWTFKNIPDPLKGMGERSDSDIEENSDNLIVVLGKKFNETVLTNGENIIEMPYFEQSSGTCWAAAAMMLRKGSYPAQDGPLSDRRIYQWMANMGIGINDGLGFFSYHLYTQLIGDDEVTYSRFFSYESVKNKIMELIDQGLPVIFARSAHIVLVLGYRYEQNGDLILIQHNSQATMYEEMPFYDSFKENAFTQLVMLTWSKIAPHTQRAKHSLGIPTYLNSAFGHLYFEGRDDENHTGKMNLRFDEQAQGGYRWEKQGNVDDDFFQDHATQLQYEIPLYNGDRHNSAAATLWLELVENDHPENSIHVKHDVTVPPAASFTVSDTINLTPLKNAVESATPFSLYIGLLDTATLSSTTDVILEKINLGPLEEEEEEPEPVEAIISTFDDIYAESYDRWGIGAMAPGFASDWFQAKDVAGYKSSGGNPGGYISWIGSQGDWWFFATYSSKYRGDRSFAFGKKLTFDLKTDNTKINDPFSIPFVVISGKDGAGQDMHIFQPQSNYPEPGAAWTSYSIDLQASSGWRMSTKDSLTGAVDATAGDIRQVLSTLSSLRIRGEYGSSRATGALDNVVLGGN